MFFFIYKGDDAKEDSSNEKNDKPLEDGNDIKSAENEKSSEDIWCTDFAVSKQVFLTFAFKMMFESGNGSKSKDDVKSLVNQLPHLKEYFNLI